MTPVVDEIKKEFEQMNEKSKTSFASIFYKFQDNYNVNVLRQLKRIRPEESVKSEPLKIVHKIVKDFANQSMINFATMIDLLINKCRRNCVSHGIIDSYINNVLNNENDEIDIINYLEEEHLIKIVFNGEQEDILKKLVHINIKLRCNETLLLVVSKLSIFQNKIFFV